MTKIATFPSPGLEGIALVALPEGDDSEVWVEVSVSKMDKIEYFGSLPSTEGAVYPDVYSWVWGERPGSAITNVHFGTHLYRYGKSDEEE